MLAACKPPAPPTVNDPPRLDAVEACAEPSAGPLPVPMGRGVVVGFHDEGGYHPATALCDLPDRIVLLAAEQSVHGKRGTAWSIPRTGGAATEARILPSSPGCNAEKVTCAWETDAPGTPSIEVLRAPPRLPTSGWVHGSEDMCRALPDDTFAVCSTAHRMVFVTPRCGGGVSIALHDATLPRAFDLDVEVPVTRVHGTATQLDSGRWTYAGEGLSLTIDIDAHRGALTVGGQNEDCIAFGLYSG